MTKWEVFKCLPVCAILLILGDNIIAIWPTKSQFETKLINFLVRLLL